MSIQYTFFSQTFLVLVLIIFVSLRSQIEQYAPGLPQKVGDAAVQLWTNARSTSAQVYASGSEFFKTKVFV